MTDAESFLDAFVRPGWVRGDQLVWAVRRLDAPRLLGVMGLHGVAKGSAEIGYWMAPWARGQGVAGRATRVVVDHAFDPEGLALARLTWSAIVGNWPSRRLAWRCGFRLEGVRRGHGEHDGRRYDMWVGGLLADDPREPAEPWPAAEAGDGAAVRPR